VRRVLFSYTNLSLDKKTGGEKTICILNYKLYLQKSKIKVMQIKNLQSSYTVNCKQEIMNGLESHSYIKLQNPIENCELDMYAKTCEMYKFFSLKRESQAINFI